MAIILKVSKGITHNQNKSAQPLEHSREEQGSGTLPEEIGHF